MGWLEKLAEIDALVAEISMAAQEQSTGLVEVNTAINQMDQVVQKNAAMVEEATASSHALTGEARELATIVSRFQIVGDQAGRHTGRTGLARQEPFARAS